MKIPGWNGVKKTIDANKRIKSAQADYQQKHAQYTVFAEHVQHKIYELGQARISAVRALELAVKVIGKAKMGDHDNNAHQISHGELVKIEQQSAQLAALAGGSLATGLSVGALSAIGAYGIAGVIGTASTGTAIASLSGAAATNATLAALGGGTLAAGGLGMAGGAAILSGVFALPALAGLVIGAEVIGSKAEKKANENIDLIRVETAKIDRDMARLKAIQFRVRELNSTTVRLTESLNRAMHNVRRNWFMRIITAVKRLVIRKREYDERIYQVTLIAKSLSAIVDEPVAPQERTK
jgi:hypothetical protein